MLDLAYRLLVEFKGLEGLDAASEVELQRVPGVGPVKAIELKAAFEIGRRLASLNPTARARISSPEDIVNLVGQEMAALPQEHLRVLLMNTKNQVIHQHEVYRGTLNATPVRMGELFREAIRHNCAAMVMVHNHPSGDPEPSPDDIRLTREAREAGRLLDIEVLDHVVVARQGHVSLRELGAGFEAPGRRG